MSISTKIPHPFSLKTLKFSSLHSAPTQLTFFRTITFERISSKSNLLVASSQSSLQPLEELPPKLQEIVKLFQGVDQPKSKYEQLLFYGKNLKPLDNQCKTIENKVQGCVSQVWVRAYLMISTQNVVVEADTDSLLTEGLAALLVQGLSGRPVGEILKVCPDFVSLLGLQQSIIPSRNNGFLNMLKLMQKKALQLYVKADNSGQSESSNEVASSVDGNVESVGARSQVIGNDVGVLRSRGMIIKERLEKELKPIELQVEDIASACPARFD